MNRFIDDKLCQCEECQCRLPFYAKITFLAAQVFASLTGDLRLANDGITDHLLVRDDDLEEIVGFKGPDRKIVFGAVRTLINEGRLSITMFEQVILHSKNSYEDYIKLLIRSLPPSKRSDDVNKLLKSKFKGFVFHTKDERNEAFDKMLAMFPMKSMRLKPPEPLGDNRHDGKAAAAVILAKAFFDLFDLGILFGNSTDVYGKIQYPRNRKYINFLYQWGHLFGINDIGKTIKFGSRPNKDRLMYLEELYLRAWYALYLGRRISLTELETALMNGTIRELFTHACSIASKVITVPVDDDDDDDDMDIRVFGVNIITEAHEKLSCDCDCERCNRTIYFQKLREEDCEGMTLYECDYCGKEMEKDYPRCVCCMTTMYCNKECQRNDWKRHKYLCPQYQKEDDESESS